MSGTLNKVMLIGHLGDEVKIHRFEDGGCVGRFPLATNETYMNKQTNERVSNTEWHNIVLRNKAAEICEKYLSKGDKVYVEGRIKTRKWQDASGTDKYSTEIVLKQYRGELVLLDKLEQRNAINNENKNLENNDSPVDSFIGKPNELDDDIPF